LSSQTILYVDGDSIRVVQAETRKGSLVVDKMCSVDEAGLDACLHDIKAGSLTVCANFDSLRQHVVFLPLTKDRYLDALIAGQLQDRFEETGEHSFFFSVLGETKIDGEKWLEIAVFVVDDSELNSIITRFSCKGRAVTSIFPNVCALERLAEVSMKDDPDYDKSIFCVADLGQSKALFVLQQGKLSFSRDIPSPGFGIHEQDVQSINMTISYCSQNLRIVPAKVLIMSLANDADTPHPDLMIPAKWVALPEQISGKFENIREYLVPLCAPLPCRDPLRGNLLPKWYRTLLARSKSLDIMTLIIAVTLLLLSGYTAVTAMETMKAKNKVMVAKQEIREMESLMPRFRAFKEELDSFAPLLAYSNAQLNKPDMQRVLTMVAALGRPEYSKSVPGEIRIVDVPGGVAGKGAVNVAINGRLAVGTFTEMNHTYQSTLNAIRSFPNSEITSSSMDLKESGFHCTVQVRNK
jgi:hypothetical protein